MHHRVGLGDANPFSTEALIKQGIDAGVKYASSFEGGKKLSEMTGDAFAGATVGAAIGTTIFPGIGTVVGAAAGALIAFVTDVLTSIGQHSCSFTIAGGPPVQCSLYGRNIISAIDWLRTHPVDAITMHVSSLSQMFNIVEGDEIRKSYEQIKNFVLVNPNDLRAAKAAADMPSAGDLLRIAQVPAASAWIAAQPQKITMGLVTLPQTFPALSLQDAQEIVNAAQPAYATYVAKRNQEESDRAAGRTPSGVTSTTSKVVTGVVLTAAAATIGTWVYARITHQTFRQVVKSWVPSAMRGRRRNPLPSALGSTTAGRVLAYRVQLGFPGGDAITFNTDGTATYTQQQRAVAVFRPTTYQLAKIRTGRGEVLIFTDQILRNLLAP